MNEGEGVGIFLKKMRKAIEVLQRGEKKSMESGAVEREKGDTQEYLIKRDNNGGINQVNI